MAVQAKEAEAVTIVGYGNSKNKWNGYAEVELCTTETPVEAPEVEVETPEVEVETPEVEVETPEVEVETPEVEVETPAPSPASPGAETIEFTELPFPEGRKGFNVVNLWVHVEITAVVAADRVSWRNICVLKMLQ